MKDVNFFGSYNESKENALRELAAYFGLEVKEIKVSIKINPIDRNKNIVLKEGV